MAFCLTEKGEDNKVYCCCDGRCSVVLIRKGFCKIRLIMILSRLQEMINAHFTQDVDFFLSIDRYMPFRQVAP